MFSGAPDRGPLLSDPRVPPGASPSASPVGASPFDCFISQVRVRRQASIIFFFFGAS